MKIEINKIVRANIFCDEFKNLLSNNIIDFENNRFAVVYGPNGTGKTSLALVLNKEKGSEYTIKIDEKTTTEIDESVFHVISDQNGRNIIAGSTEDFILGDNVKREYELKRQLEDGFKTLFDTLANNLKSKFNIKTKSNPLSDVLCDNTFFSFVSDLANAKSKGKSIDRSAFLKFIGTMVIIKAPQLNEEKQKFFADDYGSNDSVIRSLSAIKFSEIPVDNNIQKIEESDDAVGILNKYPHATDCIVCDSSIESPSLLEKKKYQKETALKSLTPKAKEILETIINKINGNDPFDISTCLKMVLKTGDFEKLNEIAN